MKKNLNDIDDVFEKIRKRKENDELMYQPTVDDEGEVISIADYQDKYRG